MKNKRRECKRAAAMLLAALMVVNSVDLSAFTAYAAQAELVPEKTEQSASSKECVMTITDFEELEEDVMQQLLPVGTSEEEIIFPDTLNVTVSVSDTQEEGVSEGKSESKETVSGNDVSESEKEEAGTVGETESETGEHESETPESEEGNVSDSQAEENEETDNTETASIFQTILSAFAPMTVYAAWEQATNDGEETAQTKKVTLTGVTWEIDPAESDGEVFDSCEDCDGYCYVYTPVLPETDEDGNKVTLGDNVEAPVIYVLIGEDENHVSAIAEEGYDDDGFCTAWEWVDGTLKKKDGATCSHTDCNGYEKPEWNSLEGYYEISNAGELYWFADYINQHPANEGENAKLMRDITVNKDLTTKILDSNGNVKESQSVRKWIPIGKAYEKTSSTNSGIVVDGSFRATFDGDEHTISGIYYSNPGCAYGTGLFGTLCEGTISNLTLKDSYIEDTDKSNKNGRIAGICGLNDEGTITNCINVGGIVKGTKAVGGIGGINQGTISSCTNSSKVTATSHNAGGICGQNSGSSAEITNCTNESGGTIDGNSYVGGICGDNGGSVENCENNGGVSGTGNDVGGICGDNGGSVENCENKGSVTGTGEFVGGICGLHSGSGAIVSCKNVGAEVKGVKSVGGICGRVTYFDKQNQTVHTLVKECANSGSVTGTGENVGGVCGYLYFCAGITDICNTGTVSGKGLVGGIAGVLSGGDTIQNAYNAGRVTATNSSNAGVIYGKDEKGDATEENCYYLATIKSDGVQDNGGTSMTAEEFSSGKVAWLLNGSDTTGTTWRQNIDSGTKDDYPVLDGEHGTVYQCTPCKGAYSNSQEPKAHDFQKCENDSTKHVCANCEETEAHTPIYTADNSTHTISGECACGIVFGSVTLSAPTGTLTYDGTEKAATVTGSISGVTETPTISYVKVENKTETSLTEDDKPTDAGTYKASITCGSGDHTATVSVTYTIEQATPTIKTAPKVEGTIYDLTKKLSTISLTGGTVTGVNNVTLEGQWSWETPDQSLDINKTDYKATFTPTGTTNYKTVTCNVTITVEKATPTVTWSDTNKTVYYTGKTISSDKLPALTVTGVDNTDIKNIYETDDITYFYRESDGESSTGAFTKGLPTNVGTYDIKATVKEKGNYTGAETTEDNYLTLKIDWLKTDATATLTDQNGNSLTDDEWAQSVTFTAPEGFTICRDVDGTYEASFTFDNNGTDTGNDGTSVTYYLKNSDGAIAKKTQTVRIDRTAPTFPKNGGITIGDTGTWWKSLLNTITFGLAYRNTVEVKVCGTDALSGVDKYYYYIDESGNTTPKNASELDGLTFQSVDAVGSNTVTVTTLANTGDTKNYVVYAYAVDKAGNRSSYICSDGVVVDDTKPTLTLSTPAKDDETLTDSSATVTLDASEAGTYFYILKKDGETAPSGMDAFATETTTNGKTTWEAKSGIASGSMAEGNNTITLTGLDANTMYTLYVVAVDSVGNATANVQSKAFTTLKLNPTITVQPKITGTYGQKLSEMNLTDGTAAYNDTSVAGTWTITDTKKATAYPTVNGTTAYEVTFKPTDDKYAEVTVDVIPTVAKKSVTVTADNKTKTYGEANPELTFTVSEGVLVGTDEKADLGVILSCEAGQYSSVKEGGYAITGTSDSANYEVTVTPGILTIEKATAEINVTRDTYSVTYGDAPFNLGITDTSKDTDVVYEIQSGSDLIEVSKDGTVTIKSAKASQATIKVTLPSSPNYNDAVDKTITINIEKKSYNNVTLSRTYLYYRSNTDTIDLSSLLPKDCGDVGYVIDKNSIKGTYSENGAPAEQNGKLGYTVESGNVEDTGTIVVTAKTDNYKDITITVNWQRTDKYQVILKPNTSVTLKDGAQNYTYGQPLSVLKFNDAVFVSEDDPNQIVSGTLAWTYPDTKPDAGTASPQWTFTPNDPDYATVSDTVSITVSKATPNVVTAPTVNMTYHPNTTLSGIDLNTAGTTVTTGANVTAGRVNGIDGNTLSGSWSWKISGQTPGVNNSGYEATFTPQDQKNYATVERTITVTVAKATPYIATVPTAAEITYGETLGSSALTGGTVQYSDSDTASVEGNFVWERESTIPKVSDSNTTSYTVIFKPTASDNYNEVETNITITVNKAENAPNMPGSTMSVANSCKTVGAVELPGDWEWNTGEAAKTLTVGVPLEATAVYKGADKGNYENESVNITITRSACDHVPGEILYTGTGEHEPDCVNDGLGHRECTKCHEITESGIVVPALGHRGGTATCNKRAVCDNCHQEYGSTNPNNHAATEVRGHKNADCTSAGYTGDTHCVYCGKMLQSGTVIAALGHDYKNEVTTEPTTTSTGVRTYTCKRCGYSYTETIAKLPEETHNHSYTGTVTRQADCTNAGVKTYTCSCGDSYTESIPALGHHYISKVTKWATTTAEGIMTYTCDRCGHSYTRAIAKLANSGDKPGNDNQQDNTDKPGSNNQQDNTDKPGNTGKPDTGKPYIEGRADKNGWENIKDQLDDAKEKDTITVDMNGTTVVPGDVFDTIRGKDVNVVFDMGDGITWTVNGKDITADKVGDIDFGVTVGSQAGKTIPVDIINNVTGERYSMNVSLAYDGEFGFKATLSLNVGRENAGLYANLFYYNPETNTLEYMSAGIIDEEGNAHLDFTHASDYSIVIDTEDMKTADTGSASTVPATADGTDAWNPWWIIIIGAVILIIGIGVFFVAKKKRETEE